MNDVLFDLAELDKIEKPTVPTNAKTEKKPKKVNSVVSPVETFNTADLDKIQKPAPRVSLTRPKATNSAPTSQKSLNQDEIEAVARKAGWEEDKIPTLSAIAMGEGAIDPNDKTRRLINSYNPGFGPGGKKTVEQSVGLLQINMHPSLTDRIKKYDRDRLAKDPVYNLQVAREIYDQKRNDKIPWNHWGAYSNGSYKKFFRGKAGQNVEVLNDWQPSAVTPSGAPAVNFEAGDYVKASYPYSTEEYAAFERLKGNKTSAKSLSKQAQIPSEVLTDSVGNQYFSASQDGVPEGYTRVKSTNLSTKEERTFLIDKDRNVLPEIKPGVPMNPNMRYDMKGNEYSFKEDLPDGTKRFERIGENGQPQTFIFNKDGSIKQEGVTTTPDWVFGQTPGKSPLPNDKAVQMIHERLLKAGAKDSEEMRQRLIRGYNDKMSGKTPTMFNPEEIAMLEDLQNKIEIAEAQGQPTPTVQTQSEQGHLRALPPGADPQSIKGGWNSKLKGVNISVEIPDTVTAAKDATTANRLAAEQAIKKSGKYARGKEYDELQTKAIVDRIEGTRGSAAVNLDTNTPAEGFKTNDTYNVSGQNMAENEAYLKQIEPKLQEIRNGALSKFIESTVDLDEDSLKNLTNLGLSAEDIKLALGGEEYLRTQTGNATPSPEIKAIIDKFAANREKRKQNKAIFEEKYNKYLAGGDSPKIAGLKAYSNIGLIGEGEVYEEVLKEQALREKFLNASKFENKSFLDQSWDLITNIPVAIQKLGYIPTQPGSAYVLLSETAKNVNEEAPLALRTKELRWGSLERYTKFLEMEGNMGWDTYAYRHIKQFARTIGQMGASALKTGGVIDSVWEKTLDDNKDAPWVDDYLPSFRNAANWTSYLLDSITGQKTPTNAWVNRGDVDQNPLIQMGNQFQQWLGEDEYLQTTLAGKGNSAIASGLTFLAGGALLRGVKYGAGVLGVLSQVGSTYDDLRQKGMSADEAKYWALGIGVPLGFSEQWGLGGAGKRALSRLGSDLTDSQFKLIARSMWDFTKSTHKVGREEFLEEFLQEWGQSTFGKSAVNAVTAQDKTAGQKFQQFFKDLPKQAGESLGDAVIAGFSGYALGTGANTVVALANRGREKDAILADEQQRNINITLWNNNLKIDGEKVEITEEIKPLVTQFAKLRKQIIPLQREKYDLSQKSKKGETVDQDRMSELNVRIALLTTEQQILAEEIGEAAGIEVVPSAITGEYKQSDLNIPDVDFAPTDEMPDDVNEWADEANPGKQQIGMDFGEEAKPFALESLVGRYAYAPSLGSGKLAGIKGDKAVFTYTDKYGKEKTAELDLDKVQVNGVPLDEAHLSPDAFTSPTAPTANDKPVLRDITGEVIRFADGTEGLFVGFKNGKAIIDHSKKGEIYQKRDTFELGDVYFQGSPLSEYSLDEEIPAETAKPTEAKTVEPFWMVNEKTGERIKISYNDDIGEYIWKKPGTTDQLESSAMLPEGWVRETIKKEPVERPPLDVTVAEQNRKTGKFVKDGVEYVRQEKGQVALEGSKDEVKFADTEEGVVPITWGLIEADKLQPVHLGGNWNYNNFLPEAQPNIRTDDASKEASDSIANNPRFGELSGSIGGGGLAFSGAPTINERGEIIQGNNRGESLKKGYGLNRLYHQQLLKNVTKFGFKVKDVSAMKNPILVRVFKGTDEQGIALGSYKQGDVESGTGMRITPGAVVRRIPYEKQVEILKMLFEGLDLDTTLNAAIKQNIKKIVLYLSKYITNAQIQNWFNKNEVSSKTLTEEGLSDIEKLLEQFLLARGPVNLEAVFQSLPKISKDALASSMPLIFSVTKEKNLVPEIHSAIMIAGTFLEVSDSKSDAAFDMWQRQGDLYEPSPMEFYTPQEMFLAGLFIKAKRFADIKEPLGLYAEYIKGGEGLLVLSNPPLSKPEAIEKAFKVKYLEAPTIQNEEENTTNGQMDEVGLQEPQGMGDESAQRESEGEKGTTETAAEPEQENVSEKPEQSTSERLPEKLAEPGLGEPQVIEPAATAVQPPSLNFFDLKVGDKVILSEQVDYLKPNEVYEIIEVGKKQMYFQNVNTGGKTYVRKGLLVESVAKGILTLAQEKTATETPTVDEPAKEAATSPTNNLPEPTEGQKEAGNYKKGHVVINGLDVTIENPVGSKRTGTNRNGKKWSVTMKSHYGYIKRTEGADGEHIDLFIKEGTPLDYNGEVYVIDQIEPTSGEFDEHKIMFGYASEKEAREAYLENYAKEWKGLDSITPMDFEMFRNWTKEVQETPAVETTKEKGEVRTEAVAEVMQPLNQEERESIFDDWFADKFGPTEEPEPVVADTADEFDKTVEKVFGQIDFTPQLDFIADTKVLGQKVKVGESEVVVAEEQEKIRQQSSILESLLNCVKTP